MKFILVVMLIVTVLFQASCATVLRSPTQPLTVRTNVPSAKVEITANVPTRTSLTNTPTQGFYYVGSAPQTFDLPRGGTYNIVVSKQGYNENSAMVLPKLGAEGVLFSAGNIVFGGLGLFVGAAIDVTSGAIYQHDTQYLYLPLDKLP